MEGRVRKRGSIYQTSYLQRTSLKTGVAVRQRVSLLFVLLFLLAQVEGVVSFRVRWTTDKRENAGGPKARTRVVVVLGAGCPRAAVDSDLEASCGAIIAGNVTAWRKAGKDDAIWKHPSPECAKLPELANSTDLPDGGAQWEWHCDYKLAYSRVFRQAEHRLRELGWANYQVVEYVSAGERRATAHADVIIAPLVEYLADLRDRYSTKRFIVIHTDDSATINFDLDLNSPLLAGVLMHTSFVDKSENNKPAPFYRRHSAWMLPPERLLNLSYAQRDPPISKAAMRAKIHTVIPQVQRWAHPLDCGGRQWFTLFQTFAFQKNDSWSPPLSERPIDIAFLGVVGEEMVVHRSASTNGSTVYKESGRSKTGVRGHRQAAEAQIIAMTEKYNLTCFVEERKMRFADYVDVLRNTKVFISPFGLGEFSGKDYEAVLAGALVVKPLASALKSYPNIYTRQMMLETRVDFSDLEDVVMPYLSDRRHLATVGQKKVQDAQNRLRRAADINKFADDVDGVLEQLVLTGGAREHL